MVRFSYGWMVPLIICGVTSVCFDFPVSLYCFITRKISIKTNLEVDPVLCIYIPFWKLLRECIFFRYLYRFILLCITMYRQKSIRKFFIYIFPIVCGALGYLILLLSPSGSAKFSENLSLSLLFKNAIAIFTEYYNACRIPLILFLYFLALRFITN